MSYCYKRELGITFSIIVFGLYAFYFTFFNRYHSINCVYNSCTAYHQTGLFGSKTMDYSFNRKDVERYEIGTNRHKSGKRSYHTDYYPILIMKDGQQHELPYKFCREKYRAEEFALDIMMSTTRIKKSEHPFGW